MKEKNPCLVHVRLSTREQLPPSELNSDSASLFSETNRKEAASSSRALWILCRGLRPRLPRRRAERLAVLPAFSTGAPPKCRRTRFSLRCGHILNPYLQTVSLLNRPSSSLRSGSEVLRRARRRVPHTCRHRVKAHNPERRRLARRSLSTFDETRLQMLRRFVALTGKAETGSRQFAQ